MTQTQGTVVTQNPPQGGQSGGIPVSDVAVPVVQSTQATQEITGQVPEVIPQPVSEVPVTQQVVQEASPQVSAPIVSPVPSQEKGFLDSMIDKGASAIASMTGQPDPFTGQTNTSQTTPVIASNPQQVQPQQGFFGKLR
ncbi:MAG: hypothetical protein LBD75_00550 [Candidatus Peribacteria bacterium]|nr:hypothetical protein [Candidatus Peribacteria bacterium]